MAAFGQSKHGDKQLNNGKPMPGKIYSYSTMDNYTQSGLEFARWAREAHGCRDIDDARQFVEAYLQERIDAGKSAWTVARDASALSKLYGTTNDAWNVELPSRQRGDVTQHRTGAEKGHFSYERHADLVDFCHGTGLRRHEILPLTADNVEQDGHGHVWLHNVVGKNGKVRDVEVLPKYAEKVLEIAERAQEEGRPLFTHIPKYAPCHAIRAEYARDLYELYARDVATLPRKERYDGRKDLVGQHWDKAAMDRVSHSLGHNRRDVVTFYFSNGSNGK